MMTPPRRFDSRDDQVPTVPTSIREIMSRAKFAVGVADARAGRVHRSDYDLWTTNEQWNYERGRQWAMLAPRHLPLHIVDKLNPKAVELFVRHEADII